MEIRELLNYIQIFELKALAVALFVYILYFYRRDSFVISVFSAVCLELLHFGFQSLYEAMGSMEYHYQVFAYNAWYPTFAITDFCLFFVIANAHQKLGIRFGDTARLICFTYIVQGFNQMFRYLDYVVLETDVLSKFHKVAVPTLASAMVLSICVYVLIIVSLDFKNRKVRNDS